MFRGNGNNVFGCYVLVDEGVEGDSDIIEIKGTTINVRFPKMINGYLLQKI